MRDKDSNLFSLLLMPFVPVSLLAAAAAFTRIKKPSQTLGFFKFVEAGLSGRRNVNVLGLPALSGVLDSLCLFSLLAQFVRLCFNGQP